MDAEVMLYYDEGQWRLLIKGLHDNYGKQQYDTANDANVHGERHLSRDSDERA